MLQDLSDELLDWAYEHAERLKALGKWGGLGLLLCFLLYRMLAGEPEHVGPDLKPGRRVVILLHGHGAAHDDLVPLCEELSAATPEVACVTPGAPHRVGAGFTWYPSFRVPREEMVAPRLEEYRAEARGVVVEAIDELREEGVQDRDIFVGGFSQGATVAMDVFLNEPDAADIGAVISLSGGALDLDYGPLVERAPPRTFVSHGLSDSVLGADTSREIVDLLEEGGHEVEFVEFEGGHQIAPEVRARLGEFIRR